MKGYLNNGNTTSELDYYFNCGYKKAIDDFVDICLRHKSKDDYPVMCFDEFTINKFAEQLKEGVKNATN